MFNILKIKGKNMKKFINILLTCIFIVSGLGTSLAQVPSYPPGSPAASSTSLSWFRGTGTSCASPMYSSTADIDSGVCFPAANEVGVAAAGVEEFKVGTGYVSIGGTNGIGSVSTTGNLRFGINNTIKFRNTNGNGDITAFRFISDPGAGADHVYIGTGLSLDGIMVPAVDNTGGYTLGLSGRRWFALYSMTGTFSTSVTAAINGSGGGVFGGASSDVQWYRNAADVWRTPDNVTIDGSLTATGGILVDSAGGAFVDVNTGSSLSGFKLAGIQFIYQGGMGVAGACTTPTTTWTNGSLIGQFDVGTSCTGITTIVVNMGGTGAQKFGCFAQNLTAPSTRQMRATAWTTSTVTFTNMDNGGTAQDFTDGADILVTCPAAR